MASSSHLHRQNSFSTRVSIPQVNPNVSFSQFAHASSFAPPAIPQGFLSHPNPPASVLAPTEGALKGSGPAVFDGSKDKAREFMRDFQIWWMQNNNNLAFKTPYNCIAFFLGKMRGIKVMSWIDLQLRELNDQLHINPGLRTDEVLWEEFQKKFNRKFTSASAIEEVQAEFENLRMDGEYKDIDLYIAKFKELVRKVGWNRTDVGVLQKFQEGLIKWIVVAILNKDIWPETLDKWIEAARQEVR